MQYKQNFKQSELSLHQVNQYIRKLHRAALHNEMLDLDLAPLQWKAIIQREFPTLYFNERIDTDPQCLRSVWWCETYWFIHKKAYENMSLQIRLFFASVVSCALSKIKKGFESGDLKLKHLSKQDNAVSSLYFSKTAMSLMVLANYMNDSESLAFLYACIIKNIKRKARTPEVRFFLLLLFNQTRALKNSVNLGFFDENGWNNALWHDRDPLCYVVFYTNTDVLSYLIESGALKWRSATDLCQEERSVQKVFSGAKIAMMLNTAVKKNNLRSVEYLLTLNGSAIDNQENDSRKSPLMIATAGNFIEIFTFLLKNKASLQLVDNQGNTALHCAARNGYAAIALLLLQHGADIFLKNTHNETPFYLAAKNGFIQIYRYLWEAYQKKNNTYRTKKRFGFFNQKKDNILQNMSCLPSKKIFDHHVFLCTAAVEGHFNLVDEMIGHGVNIALSCHQESKTPLDCIFEQCQKKNFFDFKTNMSLLLLILNGGQFKSTYDTQLIDQNTTSSFYQFVTCFKNSKYAERAYLISDFKTRLFDYLVGSLYSERSRSEMFSALACLEKKDRLLFLYHPKNRLFRQLSKPIQFKIILHTCAISTLLILAGEAQLDQLLNDTVQMVINNKSECPVGLNPYLN